MADSRYQERFDPKLISRQTNRRLVLNGLIALLVTIVIIVAGVIAFPLTQNLDGRAQWGNLDGFSSLATLAIIIGGLIFAYFEHTQNAVQRSRDSAQASMNLYKEVDRRLNDPAAIEARRWIIVNVPVRNQMGATKAVWMEAVKRILNEVPDGWEGERPPGKENLKAVLICFDFIGFIAQHYWSMENELVEWMSPLVAKIWERVGEFVEDEARRRNEADYYRAARDFGNYCIQWRREHYPDSTFIEDAT
ncbi:MAG: hypothetical protein ISR58_12080 [Anaerolineales bacterium]|nr:hypothetical protein [Chloroflexota bacterium]MBL6981915.1 hypothetical protein [Anaerolineales bacterium]